MSYILELKNVTKAFPGVKALDKMQLQLKEGELLAVCGENGAGKSTLMKVITGVYIPDEGEILLNGQPVTIKDPNDAYDKGIAIIYQETSLFPELTVLDNIFIGHEPTCNVMGMKLIDYKLMRQRAEDIFRRLDMDIDLNAMVSELGVAAKQMVEIAKALTYDSKILILDEPTAALTSKEVKSLFNIISALKKEGVSMIYISHRLEEIFQIADRVTVIRDGGYVETADTKDVSSRQLISWMVGRELENLYPKTKVEIGQAILELEGIEQENILHNVNLVLKKGEILGISGLAGSGRTELAHAICGFSQIDGGKVLVEGKEVKINNYQDAMASGIVYVSEDRKENGLVTPMSVKENFSMSILASKLSSFKGIKTLEEDQLCKMYISMLSIKTPSPDVIINNLSGGNQQKVSVSKALACDPKILILDEPTRGVDVGAKSEIHRIISDLAAKGLSIILISSDMPEVLGMSDRIVVMKEGRIVGEFEEEEATGEALLAVAL